MVKYIYPIDITEDTDMGYELERFKAFLQTKMSPVLTIDRVAEVSALAGWTGEDLVTAVAVAGAESGYRVNAKNVAKNGTEDTGLFQVNSIHSPYEKDKYDPEMNARFAYGIWERRKKRGPEFDGFRAWVAYKNGKHLPFMDAARVAVQRLGAQRQEGQ